MENISRSSNKVMILRLPEDLFTSLQQSPNSTGTISYDQSQSFLILTVQDHSSKSFSGRVEETEEGLHIFTVGPSKKSALKSKVAYRSILTPKISSISAKLKQDSNKQSEFEIKLVDAKEEKKKSQKNVFKLHPNHKSFVMANQVLAAQATIRKKYKEKRVRGDPERVREQLFYLFEKQLHWKTKALADETDQPESFLNDILQDIGDKETSGQYRGCWKLKSMFRSEESESGLVKKQKI